MKRILTISLMVLFSVGSAQAGLKNFKESQYKKINTKCSGTTDCLTASQRQEREAAAARNAHEQKCKALQAKVNAHSTSYSSDEKTLAVECSITLVESVTDPGSTTEPQSDEEVPCSTFGHLGRPKKGKARCQSATTATTLVKDAQEYKKLKKIVNDIAGLLSATKAKIDETEKLSPKPEKEGQEFSELRKEYEDSVNKYNSDVLGPMKQIVESDKYSEWSKLIEAVTKSVGAYKTRFSAMNTKANSLYNWIKPYSDARKFHEPELEIRPEFSYVDYKDGPKECQKSDCNGVCEATRIFNQNSVVRQTVTDTLGGVSKCSLAIPAGRTGFTSSEGKNGAFYYKDRNSQASCLSGDDWNTDRCILCMASDQSNQPTMAGGKFYFEPKRTSGYMKMACPKGTQYYQGQNCYIGGPAGRSGVKIKNGYIIYDAKREQEPCLEGSGYKEGKCLWAKVLPGVQLFLGSKGYFSMGRALDCVQK